MWTRTRPAFLRPRCRLPSACGKSATWCTRPATAHLHFTSASAEVSLGVEHPSVLRCFNVKCPPNKGDHLVPPPFKFWENWVIP